MRFDGYRTLKSGEAHHKRATSEYWILRLYYGDKLVLGGLVLGAEVKKF
jgi:hypothetical protein